MSIWRYKAVAAGAPDAVRSGEMAGDSAAEVRASLRRVGLQVIALRPAPAARTFRLPAVGPFLDSHLRRRRTSQRAELYDGLATMLDSGLPLLEAVDTLAAAAGRSRRLRLMLVDARERLRSGAALGDAMRAHASWFDSSEIAMVEAGQHRGELAGVLRRLAERHQRSGELTSKLVGVLTYPAVVSLVGLGVVVFLSTRTLPNLVGILRQAKIDPPRLTSAMMWGGQAVWHWWPLMALGVAALVAAGLGLAAALARREASPPAPLRRLVPRVLRRMGLARLCLELSEMMRAGVPLVEALRVLAPTLGGPVCGSLGRLVRAAADRVERGEPIDAALEDPFWFDAEFSRLLATGRASGELPELLARLGEREVRRSARLVDRWAAMLEPAVILVLAALVGTVVMAAVLPLIRLQEVI